jgi:dihydrofolate synthase / folylpolyglutamate synthase
MIDAILDRLTRLHPKVIDLSLDRVHRLLARLGDPHHALPPVVHVAGTNGKGSTVAYLRAFFEAAGRRAHVYTSPHLVRFAERIRIAGHLPTDGELARLLAEVERANAGEPVTFFEITTAAAFLAFSRVPADVCLLETGLGGRLDATNVVERPALTVLTPIALDHQKFLGDTLAAIAGEKAGILKPGVPCVSAAQDDEALAVIAARADRLGVPLRVAGRDFVVAAMPPPALPGAFQIGNAGLALAAIDQICGDGRPFPAMSAAVLARGLATVDWPARLQRLRRGPLVDRLPAGWELWLDGGHNPHAGRAIAAHAALEWRDRPLLAICGMLATKDIAGYLAPLAAELAALRGVGIAGEAHALPAPAVAAQARACGMADVAEASGPDAALADLIGGRAGPCRVLICGSLYLAGRILRDHS